jgi:hypothetical protein
VSSSPKTPEHKPRRPRTDAKTRQVYTNVADLSDNARQLVEHMLARGATFEDVVETLDERHQGYVTLQAVRNFFRDNLELQKRRVLHQVETAEALKASLAANPQSAEGRLAEAAFLTGYMGLTRQAAAVTLKDSERARMENENLHLRQQTLALKRDKTLQDRNISRARARLLSAQWRLAKAALLDLQRKLEKAPPGQALGPETLQKIRQIYGLIAQPAVPAAAGQTAPGEEGNDAPSQA